MQTQEATYALNTLDRSAIERLIRSLWKMRLRDAPAAILKFCAPDVRFRIIGGPPAMPGPWDFDGRDATVEAIRTIDTNLVILTFEIIDVIVDNGRVALRWFSNVENRGTGVAGELSVFDYVEVRDGLISSYIEFLDTDGFRRLMMGEPQHALARASNRRQGELTVLDAPEPPAFGSPIDMDARNRKEQVLRDMYRDRLRSGPGALAGYLTEDCELHLIGDPLAVPFARSHVGRHAVIALVEQIDIEFIFETFDILSVLVDRDRAAVHWCATIRHRGTGAQGHVEAFDHVIFSGDLIQKITEFFDTAQTARVIAG